MKFSWCTLFFMAFTGLLQAQNVNIPDANFKAALLNIASINTNGDSEIQLSEAQAAQFVSVSNQGISDLTGIEEFTNIIALFCSNNSLVTLDVRNLTKLSTLVCSNNQLTSLQIATNNVSLTNFNAKNNQLTSIDLTGALDSVGILNLSHNQLTSVDISSLDDDTREVYLHNNQLTSIIFPVDVVCTRFTCHHNQLTNLVVPISASRLDCSHNPLDSLWVQNTANAGSYTKCDSSQLRYISFSQRTDSLICRHNNLTKLQLNLNMQFNYIDCSHNMIDSIRITNTSIRYLDASHNDLKILGVDNATNNNIFPLDASNNPRLTCVLTNRSIPNAQNNWTLPVTARLDTDCSNDWFSVTKINNLPHVELYPNPSGGQVQINLGQVYEEVNWVLYNNLGQLIQEKQEAVTSQLELSLPAAPGIYLVKVQTEKGQAVLKAIKE